MLTFDVRFFDESHQALLQDTPLGSSLTELVKRGWSCDEEVLLVYSMFVHQKPGRFSWRTYSDLKQRLSAFRGALLSYFSLADQRLRAEFTGANESRVDQTEAMGVGCALGCVSDALGLTDADWERIDVSKDKDLDFKIASDGSQFVAVEARGRIRDLSTNVGLSRTAAEIQAKKLKQRALMAAKPSDAYPKSATLIGIIAAIPHAADHSPTIWLLDPPAIGVQDDPRKFRIVARLNYYFRNLSIICGRANFLIALANHLRGIELAANYIAFDKLPLLSGTCGEISFPQTLLSSRTVSLDGQIVGELIALGNGKGYFFGIEVAIISMLLQPNFSDVIGYRSNRNWSLESVQLTIRLRKSDTKHFRDLPENSKILEHSNRIEFAGKASLSSTPAGICVGEVFW